MLAKSCQKGANLRQGLVLFPAVRYDIMHQTLHGFHKPAGKFRRFSEKGDDYELRREKVHYR